MFLSQWLLSTFSMFSIEKSHFCRGTPCNHGDQIIVMMKIVVFSILNDLTCTTHFCYNVVIEDILSFLIKYVICECAYILGYNYVYNWRQIHVLTDICQNRWTNSAIDADALTVQLHQYVLWTFTICRSKRLEKSLDWQSRHSVYTQIPNKARKWKQKRPYAKILCTIFKICFTGETIIQISWGYSTFVYNSHSIVFQGRCRCNRPPSKTKAKQNNKQQLQTRTHKLVVTIFLSMLELLFGDFSQLKSSSEFQWRLLSISSLIFRGAGGRGRPLPLPIFYWGYIILESCQIEHRSTQFTIIPLTFQRPSPW